LDKIRVGMIGVGGIGTWGHLVGYEQIPEEAQLVAFCDTNPEAVKGPAEKHSAKAYSDYNDLLQDPNVDMVDICLPHYLHGRVALAAAKAKKHILCEKPFTVSLKEADDVINAAKENGVTLMVAENTRFIRAYEVAKTFLDQKEIGDVCHVRTYLGGSEMYRLSKPDNWIGKKEKAGGGAIMDSGVHTFYLLEWFVGRISKLFAASSVFRKDLYQDVEDNAVVSFQFENGAIGTSSFSNTTEAPWTERLELYGINGSLIVDMLSEHPVQLFSTQNRSKDRSKWWGRFGDTSWEQPYFEHSAMDWKWTSWRKEVKHFVTSLREKSQPLVTGADGRRNVEIALKALESAQTSQWVDA
jgi:UDP-N-acetyl-2-amino-2-deoxyglucuronate dehydrogenase